MKQNRETTSNLDSRSLLKAVVSRFAAAFLVLAAVFFLSAGTFDYWQAWVYMLVLVVPMIFIIRYLYKYDPELLGHRLRMRERQKTQKLIQAVGWPSFLLAFIIPGFDYRFHWSNMPLATIVISDVLVLLGYLFIGLVFKTNSYASRGLLYYLTLSPCHHTTRIVEVEKGQKLITTGPYAAVRHPMYLGVLVFYVFSPLALGSYWAVIPALLIVPILVARIMGEERELLDNLEGYKEYLMKTKYRLVPGIW